MKTLIRKSIGNRNYDKLVKLKKRKNALLFKGSEFECPVCGSKLRTFLPGGLDVEIIRKLNIVGAGRFENQMCPVCKAFNRERLFMLYLLRMTDIFSKKLKVLHIAPEKEIQNILKKSGNLEHISSDLDSPLADIKMDITSIQFPDDSFDVILCNHVLEHVPEDVKAISEFSRVLKKNGWAVLQVPISYELESTYEDFSVVDPQDREKHFGQNDHVRVYGVDYFDRLSKGGLKVKPVETTKFLTVEEIHRFGVIKEEKIFYCENGKPE